MTTERWRQLQRLYHAALEREDAQRTAYLDEACANDSALRSEVESLLAQRTRPDEILGSPALEFVARAMAESPGIVKIGQQLGSYKILSFVGAGGMGEVYEAQDTRLGRTVAIKVLPPALANDPERLARFRREAQMASSLNHPHILTVYDIGESNGQQYLVTEFVDGGTLKKWTGAEKRTWRQIVGLLLGVADGLGAAHQAGILHRDVKPDNVLVTKSEYAKLADFGLAKLTEGKQGDAALSLTEGKTTPGLMIGTISYMSPEQASGKPADARSDIFAFGVLLYEALAGRKPFEGPTSLDVLHAVIHVAQKPLPDEIPEALRDIVEKALEKDPADRYQSMKDMVVDLRRLTRRDGATSSRVVKSNRVTLRLGTLAVAALLALAGGTAIWKAKLASPAGQIHSIAVLPLENLSRDPDQEFLSEGITEAMISDLAQIHSLDVTSRTSVMRYKQTARALPEIGRELGVDAIVEGSVQRAGTRVRISVQLIRVSTDKHLWANDYERDMTDVLKLESDVAQAIAGEIQAKINPDETARLASTRSVKPEAHEEYLLGRYDFWKMTPAGYKDAIVHFDKATALDPDYAEPYAGLAVSWQYLEPYQVGPEPGIRARAAAQKALALDSNSSEAHAALGDLMAGDWDWVGADQEFRRAMELNPDSDVVCGCYTIFLLRLGRTSEALTLAGHGVKVDPLSPLAQFAYGGALYHARRYTEAIGPVKRSIELEPRNPLAYNLLSFIYESGGRPQDAVALLERPEFLGSAPLGLAYALAGRRGDALKILQKPKLHSDSWRTSLTYFALGDEDRGFDWLMRAFTERHPLVPETKYSPAFDSVRSDPRFQLLVARLHMPEPH